MDVLSIEAKIAEFKLTRPELVAASEAEIISIMLDEGLIDKNELSKLPSILSSSENLRNEDAFIKESAPEPLNITHTDFIEMLLDKSGDFRPERFTKEGLEKLYKDSNTTIEETPFGIQVIDTPTKRPVFTVNKFDKTISLAKFEDLSIESAVFRKEENGSYTLDSTMVQDFNAHMRKETTFFDDSIEIKHSYIEINNPPAIISLTKRTQDGEKDIIKDGKFLFVKDVKEELKDKSDFWNSIVKLFSAKEPPEQKQGRLNDLKRYITIGGINKFLEEYEEQNHSNFFEDVANNHSKDTDSGTQLIHCIAADINVNSYQVNKKDEPENETENNTENDTMNDILKKYHATQKQKQKEDIDTYYEYYIGTLKKNIKNNNMDVLFSSAFSHDIKDVLKRYPQIINDINASDTPYENENAALIYILKGLIDNNDKESIQVVINSVFEKEDAELAENYKNAKPEEKEDVIFEMMRTISRIYIEDYAKQRENNPKGNRQINGKIDLHTKQGAMGNCWLLASINAIRDKEKGQEYLNSLITVDDTNNTVTVNLKGVNKQYTFTKQEIAEDKVMSTGDGDLTAIEMAVEKYLSQDNPEDKYSEKFRIDSNGNWPDAAWKLLLGNGKEEIKAPKNNFGFTTFTQKAQQPNYERYEQIINDFNNDKKVYNFAFNSNPYTLKNRDKLKCTDISNGDTIALLFDHAYSVEHIDDMFVYFRNPHDSQKVYKIKKSDLRDLSPHIQSAEFNFVPAQK